MRNSHTRRAKSSERLRCPCGGPVDIIAWRLDWPVIEDWSRGRHYSELVQRPQDKLVELTTACAVCGARLIIAGKPPMMRIIHDRSGKQGMAFRFGCREFKTMVTQPKDISVTTGSA